MLLINTSTLLLEPFYGDEIPPYAILSHTWADGEVSFPEFMQLSETKNDRITSKAGYLKISATCERARNDGHCYAWIDTCCIDKTSSAELTEAINSMFGWYRQSEVCYVYLKDFMLDTADVPSREQFDAEFRKCHWFTRGWCLQELLAPGKLHFFNQKWQEIGTKSKLRQLISDITGVPETVLRVPPRKDIQEFPIAARISWIAKRHTTRIEDMSYSLLGILNVNMPMLYGEGQKAFLRLQEEIIKKYNDLSVFAWNGKASASGFMPVLAPLPSCFEINPSDKHSSLRRYSGRQLGDRLSTQFSLTNQGVWCWERNLFSYFGLFHDFLPTLCRLPKLSLDRAITNSRLPRYLLPECKTPLPACVTELPSPLPLASKLLILPSEVGANRGTFFSKKSALGCSSAFMIPWTG